MELAIYFRILRRKWWIALPVFLFTFIPVLVFTQNQPILYEATSTFVAKLSTSLEGDNRNLASALDILSRRVEIATTYAEVANSSLIKDMSSQQLRLAPEQRNGMDINSRVLAGTNIIIISVRGKDPELVTEFTNAIGRNTQTYVNGLYETYELALLDEAVVPDNPVKPQTVLFLSLGGLFGLALGMLAAFFSEYLNLASNVEGLDIIDGETGAYNDRYFQMRLQEELSRAKRNHSSLSVVLLDVNHHKELNGKSGVTVREALRRVVAITKLHLRDEDLVARVGDYLFALLLPDMTDIEAKEYVEILRTKIALAPFEIGRNGMKLQMNSSAGITNYEFDNRGLEDLMIQATRALKDATLGAKGRVALFSEIAEIHSSNGKRKEQSL
jgi:diguanylate cyclase (GGDEF)-like protein